MIIPRPALVLNGSPEWSHDLIGLLKKSEPILAADGGANHLRKLRITPSAIIGDLDSIQAELREEMSSEQLIEKDDQDSCDFEKALDYAWNSRGLTELSVLAATGGRIDHSINNLGILARECRGERLVLVEKDAITIAFSGRIELESEAGETWSVWSFDSRFRVSLSGLHWPIDQKSLAVGAFPSISNRALGSEVEIFSPDGPVLVYRRFNPGRFPLRHAH